MNVELLKGESDNITEFDLVKIKQSHDGHGRVSCETRKILNHYYNNEQVNTIIIKLENRGHIDDISYSEFQKII